MKRNNYLNIILPLIAILMFSCVGSKLGSKKKDTIAMQPLPKSDFVRNTFAKLDNQGKPESLGARARGSRGLATAYEGGLLTLGVTAVKDFIANSKKKYTDTWTQGLNDLYFYDQPSAWGPFDPVGLQFSGFNLTRMVKIGKDQYTAVKADFELNNDSLASKQIINDGVFRLKLKDIAINYSKAKVPSDKQFINMDFEITFTTSYISKDGQFYTDVTLGKFYFPVRHAPLDSTKDKEGYKRFYNKLKEKPLTGKCFIVPRSYGYYKTIDTTGKALTLSPYWNQGNFSIAVKVTESSKDSFIQELIINNSGIGIDYGTGIIMQHIAPPVKK